MKDKSKKVVKEFKEFIERGNVIDLAVGVVIGSAFTAIVTSIVENLLTPIIGLFMPNTTFAEWSPGGFGVGAVINAIISFLITAFVVFLIVRFVNKLTKKDKPKEEIPVEPVKSNEEKLLEEILKELKKK